ncbi:MAG: sigma 54-interacting transcriptional regulator [Firmicutes bacterium]|nr:sigma 54-interacting transcriptional regulator [Bacillota bacterium]
MEDHLKNIEELKERIAIYEEIINHLNQGIYITDETESLIWINNTILKNENAELEDLVGKKEYELWPDMYPASTNRYKIYPGHPAKEFMLSFFSKNGEKHDVLTKSYPYFINDKLKYIYSIGQDASYSDRRIARILEYRNKYIKKREKQQNGTYFTFDDFIGTSPQVREMIETAKRVAVRNIPVMICGQTGTGKEIIAQSIHNASLNHIGKFVGINCAAIPENLLESIMFGSVKGAFTGALDKKGLFEEASGGTLFLDEINSMPLFLQSKLLRVLQEKTFTRVGDTRPIEMTCRILCATNQRPQQLVEDNILRQDLYYRLSVVTLNIPPLKARKQDIPYLTSHFIQRVNEENEMSIMDIDQSCKNAFQQYDWPGNVREMEHAIEYMMNVTGEDHCLSYQDLPPYIRETIPEQPAANDINYTEGKTLGEIMDSHERKVLQEALKAHQNNVAQCARSLGIRRETLYYRMKKLGIDPRK